MGRIRARMPYRGLWIGGFGLNPGQNLTGRHPDPNHIDSGFLFKGLDIIFCLFRIKCRVNMQDLFLRMSRCYDAYGDDQHKQNREN